MNIYRFSPLVALFVASVNAQIRPVILPEEDAKTPETHQLVWSAEPGARYEVQRSINLLNWEVMQSFPAGATSLVQRMLFAPENRTLFFRIRQIDEQAPAITTRIPEAGGFAVRRFSELSIGLTDGTGVDPDSIRLEVGSLGFFTMASKQITYTNEVLTFNGGGGSLGAYGETVPVSLVAGDTLGNRATNAWSFNLEVEPQVVTNLFAAGPTHGPAHRRWQSPEEGCSREWLDTRERPTRPSRHRVHRRYAAGYRAGCLPLQPHSD